MSRFTQLLTDGELDDSFRDQLNGNFDKADSELTRVEQKANDYSSNNNARMTQIEQDGITRDNEHKNSTSAHPAENITYTGPINALTAKAALEWLYTQINNIVASAGTGNTEIVDGRLGADGIARATIGLLLREIHAQQLAANKQTVTIGHGVSIIQATQSSPVKVEFYGNTLSNIASPINDKNNWSVINATLINDTTLFKYGTNSQKLTLTGSSNIIKKQLNNLEIGGYYILIAESINDTASEAIRLGVRESDVTSFGDLTNFVSFTPNNPNNWQMKYLKFSPTVSNPFIALVTGGSSSGKTVNIDGVRVYKISADLYNKIGVVWGDSEVEKYFPYVSGVAHVKNPVLLAEGVNLIPPFTDSRWVLNANAKILSPYELEINASTQWQGSYIDIPVLPNTVYTLATGGGSVYPKWYDKNKVAITAPAIPATISSYATVTTPSNVSYIRFEYSNATTGLFAFKQPMLNVGQQKPFEPRNTSVIYAEVTLAGIEGNKKDILFRNFDKNIWQKTKHFETNEALTITTNTATLAKNAVADTAIIVDESNGNVFRRVTTLSGTGNEFTQGGTNNKTITFNSGAVPVTPKATYQLASPETIDLDKGEVVGDLKVNGATQVTVGSEFTYTEDPTTKKRTYLLTPNASRTGANLIEVKCEYDSNFKSSYDSTVDKVNGVAETVSNHDMLIYRMLLAMKNNSWTV